MADAIDESEIEIDEIEEIRACSREIRDIYYKHHLRDHLTPIGEFFNALDSKFGQLSGKHTPFILELLRKYLDEELVLALLNLVQLREDLRLVQLYEKLRPFTEGFVE